MYWNNTSSFECVASPPLQEEAIMMLCHGAGHEGRRQGGCNSRRPHRWRCGASAISKRSAAQQDRRWREAMHQDRLGTDAQKAITRRLESVGTKRIPGVRANFSLETTLTMREGPSFVQVDFFHTILYLIRSSFDPRPSIPLQANCCSDLLP